ncbi:MAG: ABC transporter permease, partial [Anaerolineae bacterium]|nr:ABC transporter permease [Anaerolineae bacterium]
MSSRWRKVIRDLWANKSRTFLVIVSIAIGVFAFGGLFIAQIVGLSDMNSQYLATNPANIIFSLSPFDDELVRWAARQPHVADAQGRAVQSLRLLVGDQVHNVTLYA